ncbi:Uncharacterized protein SCF082_LOCUS35562, partial [Durusdinium trenchii]
MSAQDRCDLHDDLIFLQLGTSLTSQINQTIQTIQSHCGDADPLGVQFAGLVGSVLALTWLIDVSGAAHACCCAGGRRSAQVVYLGSSVLNSAGLTILLTVSLPYTASLGLSAAASGLLISASAIGGLTGQSLAYWIIPDEADTSCERVRRSTAVTLFGQAAAHTAYVFVVLTMNDLWITWTCLLIFRALSGFFGALTNLAASLVALHMSPESEVMNLQTASQACRNLGLCIGVAGSSIALSTAGALTTSELNTRRLGAVPVMGLVLMVLLIFFVNACFVPRELSRGGAEAGGDEEETERKKNKQQPNHSKEQEEVLAPETERPEATNLESKEANDCKDCALDTKSQKPPTLSKLDDEERKALFWYAVAFNFERSFSVSAIEVATTMISQREFGMTPITTGYIFGLITVGAVLLNLLVGCTPSYIPTRLYIMWLSAIGGAAATVFLFNVWPRVFLYLADTCLFMLSNTANGVVDGIATLAALPNSEYSKKRYMNYKMLAMATARIAAAPVARGETGTPAQSRWRSPETRLASNQKDLPRTAPAS